eukprot:4657749-Prymnesium_polylepis.1
MCRAPLLLRLKCFHRWYSASRSGQAAAAFAGPKPRRRLCPHRPAADRAAGAQTAAWHGAVRERARERPKTLWSSAHSSWHADDSVGAVSYTHLRAHETLMNL